MDREKTWKCCHCGKVIARDDPFFPFCGQRCKMADLGRWMLEDYTISEPLTDEEDAPGDDAEA